MKHPIILSALALLLGGCQPGMLAKMQQPGPLPVESRQKLSDAELALKSGDFAKAEGLYAEVEKKNAGNIDAIEGQALAEMNMGKFDLAVDKFNKVLAKDGTRWRTLNAIGVLHTLKGQLPQAGQFFAAADAASPGNPAVLNNWGIAYGIAGNSPEAVSRLMQAVEAAGADPQKREQTEMNLAMVYALSGNDRAAEPILRRYLDPEKARKNLQTYAKIRRDRQQSRQLLEKSFGTPESEKLGAQPLEMLPPALNR